MSLSKEDIYPFGILLRSIGSDKVIAIDGDSFFDDAKDSAGRILHRHIFEARIGIRLQRGRQRVTLHGWARDLSESGLGAFVAEVLVLGELVTFEVPLPNCDKQVIPAKIARVLGTEYGFQFTALSAEQRMRIQATLKSHPMIHYHGKGR